MRLEVVEIREKRLMWESVVTDNNGRYRYSYWGKGRYPDQLSVYKALLNSTDDDIRRQRKNPF